MSPSTTSTHSLLLRSEFKCTPIYPHPLPSYISPLIPLVSITLLLAGISGIIRTIGLPFQTSLQHHGLASLASSMSPSEAQLMLATVSNKLPPHPSTPSAVYVMAVVGAGWGWNWYYWFCQELRRMGDLGGEIEGGARSR